MPALNNVCSLKVHLRLHSLVLVSNNSNTRRSQMGCFFSTNKASTSPQPPRKDHAVVAQPAKPSERSIAPSHAEEETVKEVLSETPKWKNPTTATKSEPQKPHQNKTLHKLQEEEEKEESKDEKKASLHVNKAQEEEASEVSEVCSFMSETMSMSTTTTTTEQREQEVEETRKRVIRSPTKLRKNRSFSGDVGGKRERKVHASRNGVGSARLAQCRDQVGQRMVNGGTRNQPRRRDPGETSFRLPRSPATSTTGDGAARSVVGRCPSARRTNAAGPENGCRKMEIPASEGKRGSANETLENPLVSLECFIFI